MFSVLYQVLANDEGQDIAEYAVMLAVILVIVVGTLTTESLNVIPEHRGQIRVDHSSFRKLSQEWSWLTVQKIPHFTLNHENRRTNGVKL